MWHPEALLMTEKKIQQVCATKEVESLEELKASYLNPTHFLVLHVWV